MDGRRYRPTVSSLVPTVVPGARRSPVCDARPRQLGEDSYEPPPYDEDSEDEDEDDEEHEFDASEHYRRRHGAAESTGDEPDYDAETQAAVDGRWRSGRDRVSLGRAEMLRDAVGHTVLVRRSI